jgi:hypothetical protein
LLTEIRAQKLDLGIRKGDNLSSVAHNLQHSGRLEDLHPFSETNAYKEVRWEQRQDKLYPLPVLPDTDGFISREE